jgi:hypothetical protein
MSQQNSNREGSVNEAPFSVVISFIVLYVTNLVTVTIGLIKDVDGFWSTFFDALICLIYMIIAIFPAIAIPYIIELLSSWIINDSLKESGITLNFGKNTQYVSLYDIICSIVILAILYYSLHALTGMSIFNAYEIMKMCGFV